MADESRLNDDDKMFERITQVLDRARTNIVRTINTEMIIAYWLIGREIVDVEQKGETRAEYGKKVIQDLSTRLTVKYGKGFSETNLWYFRQFFLAYQERSPKILHPMGGEFIRLAHGSSAVEEPSEEKRHPMGDQFKLTENISTSNLQTLVGFHPDLSWSHYRALMRIGNVNARQYYEKEAIRGKWTKRQLERQINSMYYERSLKRSRSNELCEKSLNIVEGIDVEAILKDPYVLEFLDLPESGNFRESDLESALLTRLQEFLLELGGGFAFVARQKRITIDGDHFYPDLIFYHTCLKCFVIIDLKVTKLTHGDLGQIQMYVNYFDRNIRGEGDNSTVGLILCTDKNEAVVKYVLGDRCDHIFASRYRLLLPTEEELRIELERERKRMETISSDENIC